MVLCFSLIGRIPLFLLLGKQAGDLLPHHLKPLLEGGAVGGQHDHNQHDGVDQHAVFAELAQHFGQNGQHGGGDDGTTDVADAAQHHEHQHKDGGVKLELGAGNGGVVHSNIFNVSLVGLGII